MLLLDEITAALPANLTERVLQVVQQQGADRSVIFISHRLIEIAAICNRATVLRNGETVGMVDVTAGSEDRIVELMLGEGAAALGQRDGGGRDASPTAAGRRPTSRLGSSATIGGCGTPPSSLYPGEVLGVVALEGQGQDELFDILSGAERPAERLAARRRQARLLPPPGRRDPDGRGLRRGRPCRGAADAALRPREHLAAVLGARHAAGAGSTCGREGRKVDEAVETLQIDARAGSEVRRLSGGNQQKVTIARWVASGVKTMLCFDPTRGIDIRTKTQIYVLLRDLAAAGASILLYTSELKEIQLACDRVIVIFGGRVVAEMPAAGADEAALLRAAHNLKPGAALPEEVVAVGDRPRWPRSRGRRRR